MFKPFKVVYILVVCGLAVGSCNQKRQSQQPAPVADTKPNKWSPPALSDVPNNDEGALIRYGHELIAHTSHFLGPKGLVSQTTNGMNCQNCHLDAGTKTWGNNYSAVASTYPKFRPRSGSIETIEKRVNDCIERSLNGTALDSNSKELRAFVAYIKWVGKDVAKDSPPSGSGLVKVPMMERAANAANGKAIFESKCVSCHGMDGQGKPDSLNFDRYQSPPLWGSHSYNTGAGLFRLSRFAGYVRANMPFEAKEEEQKLSDEQAWDVAAYVNSQPRPGKPFKQDWPDISKKPFDHPFGPYSDTFPEKQHKYGPWQGIILAQKK